MTFTADRIVVGRVRSRKPKSGEVPRRTAWECVLAEVDARGAGISAGSILIVRSVRAVCTHAGASALQQRLADLAGSAARPAHGEISTSADAVWFADEAELLSTLAADWLSGAWLKRWWWREILRRERLDGEFWVARARSLPAIAKYLHARWVFQPFVRRLEPRHQAECLRRIVREFDLSHVGRAIEPVLCEMSAIGPYGSTTGSALEDAAGLQEILADLVLTLAVAPAKARSPEYASQLALRFGEHARLHATRMPSPRESDRVSGTATSEDEAPPANAASGQNEGGGVGRAPADPAPEDVSGRSEAAGQPGSSAAEPVMMTGLNPATGARPGPVGSAPEGRVAFVDAMAKSTPDPIAAESEVVPKEVEAVSWNSAYGGAFYLANVLMSMGLYADFTLDAAHTTDAPFWAVLSELARRLAGDAYVMDPLVAAFDRWAGEPSSVALAAAGSAPAWTMHEDWLLPFGDEPYPFPTAQDTAGSWSRWLDCLAAYACARLRRALNAPEDGELDRLLLRRRARITETAEAVHVEYRLDELGFQLRAAGLDRNPGWVPAAARAIYFHYL